MNWKLNFIILNQIQHECVHERAHEQNQLSGCITDTCNVYESYITVLPATYGSLESKASNQLLLFLSSVWILKFKTNTI